MSIQSIGIKKPTINARWSKLYKRFKTSRELVGDDFYSERTRLANDCAKLWRETFRDGLIMECNKITLVRILAMQSTMRFETMHSMYLHFNMSLEEWEKPKGN